MFYQNHKILRVDEGKRPLALEIKNIVEKITRLLLFQVHQFMWRKINEVDFNSIRQHSESLHLDFNYSRNI